MCSLDPDELRRDAAECARKAEMTEHPADRAAWLKLAIDLERLARVRELRGAVVGLIRPRYRQIQIAVPLPPRSDLEQQCRVR
ncbi:hypothetical protein BRAS3843_1270003 [Bradyrhizobium sp. STM 3843]|nr:hypothetical protein BRAS3843_1270003 [Bradyrhizobium sp. STM 3843]